MGYRGTKKGSHSLIVHRKGFHRKGFTRKDGTHVKDTHIQAATFKIKDRGTKGRGKKLIPIVKGKMEGYHTSMSLKARRKKLDELVKKNGALKVIQQLTAQITLRKRTQPKARKIFEKDREYVRAELA